MLRKDVRADKPRTVGTLRVTVLLKATWELL
jgi:hypothetical protein